MTVDTGKRVEADVEITESGVNLPLSELGELGDHAIPGQRVRVTVTPARRRPRRNLRGVLAGKVTPITEEDIAEVRRETWHDAANG